MKFLKNKRIDPLLLGTAFLAAFLNMYGIWKDQYANAYYTAAVTSMLQSFHNFFFASFDPGGFVTVDKPPVAFWLQTLSASIFGVHGWSVILPQALAGVGSVFLIYALVKPAFGQTAARLSALAFACTPIAAAVSRTNNIDSLLVFILLLATWFLFKAVRTKKWGWSVAAFAMVGVGFNTKMLQAYMILPALYLFYLLAFKVEWKKKLKGLAISTVALLLVSLSWPVIVDSIPAANRPYVGGSQTNSILELAFGYNGISRLTGNRAAGGINRDANQFRDNSGQQDQQGQLPPGIQQGNPPQGFEPGADENSGQMPSLDDGSRNDRQSGFGGGQANPGGGGMFNTGTAGPLRLFQSSLSGQISWLLPFALLSGVGLLLGYRRKSPLTAKQKEALFWLTWLLPMMAFFSIAGFFHQYYLIMLAPAIAALTGAGWVELHDFYKNREGWKRWLLPIGIIVTAGFQVYILLPYVKQIGYIWPAGVGILGAGSALAMIVMKNKEKLARFAAIGGILVLLAAPLYWAATPIIYGGNSMLPAAGPSNGNGGGMPGVMPGVMPGGAQGGNQGETQDEVQNGAKAIGGSRENVDLSLLTYLMSNNTGEKYLFATTDAGTAEPYIIQTGKAVMAMGGFSGTDKILTVDKLKQMIQNKEVKYFLISSGGPGGGQGSSDILTWIKENGKEIPQSEWQGSTANTASTQTQYSSQNSQTAASTSKDFSNDGRNRDGNSTLYEVDLGEGGVK